MPSARIPALAVVLLTVLSALPHRATAQAPSPDQVAEIRRACRSDYVRHCSDVPTGGQAALACLKRNDASLSGECRLAVEAVGTHATPTPAAPGATDPTQAPPGRGMSLMEACEGDYRAHCRGILPGGGRALGCLLDHHASLSAECRGVLEAGRRRF